MQWRDDAGFTYLWIDYTGLDRTRWDEVFGPSSELLATSPGAHALVDFRGQEHDPGFFKAVKDVGRERVNTTVVRLAVLADDPRVAPSLQALTYQAGREIARAFDDPADAVAWLRDG